MSPEAPQGVTVVPPPLRLMYQMPGGGVLDSLAPVGAVRDQASRVPSGQTAVEIGVRGEDIVDVPAASVSENFFRRLSCWTCALNTFASLTPVRVPGRSTTNDERPAILITGRYEPGPHRLGGILHGCLHHGTLYDDRLLDSYGTWDV